MKIFKIIIAIGSFFIATSVAAQSATTDTTKLSTIKVKGVTCANDLKTIADNVEKLNGVRHCKAEKPGATTRFEVKYNPALVTAKEIYAAIEATAGCKNPNDRPYKVKQ